VRAVVEHLREEYRRALGAAAPDDADWDRELDARLRRIPEVREALERMWPVLSGGELLHDLFSFPGLIRSAADGVLSRDEQARLVRPRSPRLRDVAWSEADLALVDEADARVGPPAAARPRRRRSRSRGDDAAAAVVAELGVGGFITPAELARRYDGDGHGPSENGADEPRTFGYVLVDEAQDVSAMQWRLLARRCPSGSMTIVGDFGQASRPGALHDWDEVLDQLPDRVEPRLVTLTVNYRTPAEIMKVAEQVLAATPTPITPNRSVRQTGAEPRFVRVEADALVAALAAEARHAVEDGGTVAVVAPAPEHPALVAALADVGAAADSADALDTPVAVLAAGDAKGLEFDHVIVAEPARLVGPDAAGLRLLYVALTRATRTLTVVHAEPLPDSLGGAAVEGAPIAAS
jgi:hypothetical protein